MDAVDFLNERKRMCETNYDRETECKYCEAFQPKNERHKCRVLMLKDSKQTTEEDFRQAVDFVEEWSKWNRPKRPKTQKAVNNKNDKMEEAKMDNKESKKQNRISVNDLPFFKAIGFMEDLSNLAVGVVQCACEAADKYGVSREETVKGFISSLQGFCETDLDYDALKVGDDSDKK